MLARQGESLFAAELGCKNLPPLVPTQIHTLIPWLLGIPILDNELPATLPAAHTPDFCSLPASLDSEFPLF